MITLNNTECYNNKDDRDDKNSVAHALLQEVTGGAYSSSRSRFLNETNFDNALLPLLYKLTLPQPKI